MVGTDKKLLVLDVNGLLLDTYFNGEFRPDREHDAKVNRFFVYKRPFCDDFIQFCFENFVVGIWSSAREYNVHSLVEYIFKEDKEKLAFIWHQQHCTNTGVMHPDNRHRPVFLKELSKLWEKVESDLPWERGHYGQSNTVLIDDSPYKAMKNPDHTAIFPKSYKAMDTEDEYLEKELRPYLEGLVGSEDVQTYLQTHRIGEPSITIEDPRWSLVFNSGNSKCNVEQEVSAPIEGFHWSPFFNSGTSVKNVQQEISAHLPVDSAHIGTVHDVIVEGSQGVHKHNELLHQELDEDIASVGNRDFNEKDSQDHLSSESLNKSLSRKRKGRWNNDAYSPEQYDRSFSES